MPRVVATLLLLAVLAGHAHRLLRSRRAAAAPAPAPVPSVWAPPEVPAQPAYAVPAGPLPPAPYPPPGAYPPPGWPPHPGWPPPPAGRRRRLLWLIPVGAGLFLFVAVGVYGAVQEALREANPLATPASLGGLPQLTGTEYEQARKETIREIEEDGTSNPVFAAYGRDEARYIVLAGRNQDYRDPGDVIEDVMSDSPGARQLDYQTLGVGGDEVHCTRFDGSAGDLAGVAVCAWRLGDTAGVVMEFEGKDLSALAAVTGEAISATGAAAA